MSDFRFATELVFVLKWKQLWCESYDRSVEVACFYLHAEYSIYWIGNTYAVLAVGYQQRNIGDRKSSMLTWKSEPYFQFVRMRGLYGRGVNLIICLFKPSPMCTFHYSHSPKSSLWLNKVDKNQEVCHTDFRVRWKMMQVSWQLNGSWTQFLIQF